MEKVYRLQSKGNNNLRDWAKSQEYTKNVIKNIQDPNGQTSRREITSIPSPFARMHLVKNAFRIVADSEDLYGNTIHHKLVSDSLDVGELFFNVNKLRDKVRILIWDKNSDLQLLLNSNDDRQRLLGETLRLYLEQDAEEFHFNKLRRIYLLDYIGPGRPAQMNIIGATSPASLFFTSANDLSYVSKNIRFGNDKPFDEFFQPLCERDFDYQCYWYCLQKAMPNFAALFPEVDSYLNLSYKALSNNQKNEISQLTAASYSNLFDDLYVGTPGNDVEVLGFPLKQKLSAKFVGSDFEIRTTVFQGEKRPLVLPVTAYTKPLKYVTDKWDKTIQVSYNDATPLNARRLPGDGTVYPYLTIGDFLEDYILYDNDVFNSERFFNGSSKERKNCFLLPLRSEFFAYFTPKELMGTMPDGKKMFELVEHAGGVKAVLRIPIQRNEHITYERLYFWEKQADRGRNEGGIIDTVDFDVALFPGIRFPESEKKRYRVVLSGKNPGNEVFDAELKFYQGDRLMAVKGKAERNVNNVVYWSNTAYVIDTDFDYMVLEMNQRYRGVVLPRWQEVVSGNNQFAFAIDFGTTNTHVEYRMNNSPSKVFDIREQDMQMHKLNDASLPARIPICHDYIPDVLGAEAEFGFPIRTVLSEGENTDWATPVFPMANSNVPFVYEKESIANYNHVTSDLKWANDQNMQKRVEHYLDALFLMLRNKVLLNGGKLGETKIVWFYPASMTEARYNAFATIWEDLYQKNFGDNLDNVIPMSESVAPYYFYKETKAATTDVVSIDIGGGTTDVVVVNDGTPVLLTSFRFAANSIFGDGYGYNADSNGFVQHFSSKIGNDLRKNGMEELVDVLTNLINEKKSTDIVSFFFSLAENRKLRAKNITIDFSKMLEQSGTGKYMFVFFYAAIIYHVASILKAKGMEMPRHITFSGMGSKVLAILSRKNPTLEAFTKVIFESVYGKPYLADGLTILRELKNPKEATCKGGLVALMAQDYGKVSELKQTLLGDDDCRFVAGGMKYGDVTEELRDKLIRETNHFCELFVEWNEKFSYMDKFGAEPSKWEVVKDCCARDIRKYLADGIAKKQAEITETGADSKVEETLFFYPLVGILNQMAQNVYKKKGL